MNLTVEFLNDSTDGCYIEIFVDTAVHHFLQSLLVDSLGKFTVPVAHVDVFALREYLVRNGVGQHVSYSGWHVFKLFFRLDS